MGKIKVFYEGNLRTRAVHEESGVSIETDAPKDNQGKGEKFSPTDLLVTSLGTCVLTLVGIAARKKNLDLSGLRADIEKEMASHPRRIGRIIVQVYCPQVFNSEDTAVLEHAGRECPVHKSLSPNLEQVINFHWGQS